MAPDSVEFDCEGCGVHVVQIVGEIPRDGLCLSCRITNIAFERSGVGEAMKTYDFLRGGWQLPRPRREQ